jgi:hypothetical protein
MIAWLALGISAGTFFWKFVETYIRWPHLSVMMRQSANVSTPPMGSGQTGWTEETIDIVVINSGAEATTIVDVVLCSEDGSINMSVQWNRDTGGNIEGPDLPARIDAHGVAKWTFTDEDIAVFRKDTRITGYATRYRRIYRWMPFCRDPIKRYDASGLVTKRTDSRYQRRPGR